MGDLAGFIVEPFYLITAFAFIILMMILVLMPKPKGVEWRPFRKSLNYVNIAFGIMTVLNIIQCINTESPPHEYSLLLLIIAFYQALCFTMCFRRMLNPHSSQRIFINHLICVSIGAAVVLVVHALAPHVICKTVYWIYLAGYVCTGLFYTYTCRRAWIDGVNRLSQYYDDDMFDRMRWLRRLMWAVFAVGVLALATSIWVVINPVFVIVYTLAYAYFLICIIRYAFNANFIVRYATERVVPTEAEEVKINEEEEQEQTVSTEAAEDASRSSSASDASAREEDAEESASLESPTERELLLAAALQKWVEEKQYTKSDVAIYETAQELGTTYSFLSSYFQKHEGMSFRDWRTNLRVEEAKRLLLEDRSLSITEVLDLSGFNDRANFHRHFTRIVGCSPSAYRAKQE